jgi:hypothetical protein
LGLSNHIFMGEVTLKATELVHGQRWYRLQPRQGHRDNVAGEVLVNIQIY